MSRQYKFRGKRLDNQQWVYGHLVVEYEGTHHIIWWEDKLLEPENNYWEPVQQMVEVDPATVGQWTGRTDKVGVDVYECDEIQIRKPVRTTQTHTGDNIPNGSYTEPMEPGIETIEGTVVFRDGMFTLDTGDSMGQEHIPLSWEDVQWTEDMVKDAIATRRSTGDWWENREEGDLGYLLEEYKLQNLQELLEYVSGIQIIGNIHDPQ